MLTGLATEARGRLRALVADVSGEETSTVGVVAWTLVADGWRALRAHHDDDGLRLEVARVDPGGPGRRARAGPRGGLAVSVPRRRAIRQVRPAAPAGRRVRPLRRRAARPMSALGDRDAARRRRGRLRRAVQAAHAHAEEDIRAATTGKHGLLSRSIELDADALMVRATVLTYQWIDELRDAAYETLGVHRRARDRLPRAQRRARRRDRLGRSDRDRRARPRRRGGVPQRARRRPTPSSWTTSSRGGGGLLDGLQMRSALTSGFCLGRIRPAGRSRRAARGGRRPDAAGLRRPRSATSPAGCWPAADRAWTSVPTSRRRASRVLDGPDGRRWSRRTAGCWCTARRRAATSPTSAARRAGRAPRRAGAAAGLRRPHAVRRRGGADDRRPRSPGTTART